MTGAKAKALGKKGSAASTSSSKKKAAEDEDTGPPLKVNNSKQVRFKEEKQLKVLKWNFLQVTPEFREQLRTQLEPNVSKTLFDQLHHTDFKKHILAIETMDKVHLAYLNNRAMEQ